MITGPEGGKWILCEEHNPWRCQLCGNFFRKVWQYWVGPKSYACVCETCAE